ncbi:hypothetical protein XarbCFBP7614_13305 [Xanthomonas arboricola]|nr:hypothetical protein XarbCFBP7614_13305 [Xanthomonas arboricola]
MDESLTLHGDGFVLRRWRQDDLDALLRHANDPLVPRGLSERFPHPYTRADGEAFMRPDGLHDLRVFARVELPADLD